MIVPCTLAIVLLLLKQSKLSPARTVVAGTVYATHSNDGVTSTYGCARSLCVLRLTAFRYADDMRDCGLHTNQVLQCRQALCTNTRDYLRRVEINVLCEKRKWFGAVQGWRTDALDRDTAENTVLLLDAPGTAVALTKFRFAWHTWFI